MRVARWRAVEIGGKVMFSAREAVSELMDNVVRLAKSKCPVGEVTRKGEFRSGYVTFTVKKGRHKGARVGFEADVWTGREPGSLRDSIRKVVKLENTGNYRVYAGHKKVVYAHMVEYGTARTSPQKFLRVSFREVTRDHKRRIEDGIKKVPEVKG